MRLCVLALAGCFLAAGQSPDPAFSIYTEHPRLLLNARRLRLLKRERERTSPRWRQFETQEIFQVHQVAGEARAGAVPQPGGNRRSSDLGG